MAKYLVLFYISIKIDVISLTVFLDNKLYICDYEYSGVYEIDFKNNSVRKIASGKEPNAIKII